jgi:hypothetical protein
LAKPKIERTTDDSLDEICEEHRDRTRSDELQAIKLLTKKLPTDGVVNWRGKFNHPCGFFDRVETAFPWRSAYLAILQAARALIRETESFGFVCTFTENSALLAKAPAKSATDQLSKRDKRERDELTGDPSGCIGCGSTNHQVEDCKFNKSQFFNKTSAPYKSSLAVQILLKYFLILAKYYLFCIIPLLLIPPIVVTIHYDGLSFFAPVVQRILNSNYSDRLKNRKTLGC